MHTYWPLHNVNSHTNHWNKHKDTVLGQCGIVSFTLKMPKTKTTQHKNIYAYMLYKTTPYWLRVSFSDFLICLTFGKKKVLLGYRGELYFTHFTNCDSKKSYTKFILKENYNYFDYASKRGICQTVLGTVKLNVGYSALGQTISMWKYQMSWWN